jgi:DNA-directed RNA polymerase subunit RPC12/RpoP
MPVAGRALRNSPDDVVALTEQQVRSRLPQGEHLVMSIRKDDLIYEGDEELMRLVDSTDGGAVVIGLTYQHQTLARAYGQRCPECGSTDARRLGPADQHVPLGLRDKVSLYQCVECGTAWDA